MAALREAGDIEQTAALVVGMWNCYKDESAEAEIVGKILKNRGGSPTGRAVWAYNGNRYKVYPDAQTGGHTTSAAGKKSVFGTIKNV